jgi:anthranilate 1,2-dioxygenase small subunit
MTAAEVHYAINELMSDYAELIDNDKLEEWIDLFTEDALYRVIARENVEQNLPAPIILCTNKNMLRDRISSLRNANEFNLHYDRHIVSNARVKPNSSDTWSVAASYVVFQTTMEGQSRLFSTGRYQDKVRREGDKFLFAEKVVIVDTFSIPTLLATPL